MNENTPNFHLQKATAQTGESLFWLHPFHSNGEKETERTHGL